MTFFSNWKPYIGSIMNIVVLTAALSSLNVRPVLHRAYLALMAMVVGTEVLWRK
ncbi:hypothetical protein ACLB1Q_05915 [Escherichia coli]